VETGKANECPTVGPLLDALHTRGIDPETATMDKGYDSGTVHDACTDRDVLPVIPLKQTPAVKRGEHKPPSCEHGEWRFAGADHKRGACKWRCPTGECKPASVWIKADRLHPLIPRETLRWKGLYRRRASVERAFGRLKNEWGFAPLRVRRLERAASRRPHDPRPDFECAEPGAGCDARGKGRHRDVCQASSNQPLLEALRFATQCVFSRLFRGPLIKPSPNRFGPGLVVVQAESAIKLLIASPYVFGALILQNQAADEQNDPGH